MSQPRERCRTDGEIPRSDETIDETIDKTIDRIVPLGVLDRLLCGRRKDVTQKRTRAATLK